MAENPTRGLLMNTRTFALTGPINLHGRIGTGSFTVHSRDDLTEATVTLAPRDAGSGVLERTEVELRGATLTITGPRQGGIFDLPIFGGRGRDAMDVTVTVPTGTAIKLSTLAGAITVDGRCGGADIASGDSDINIEHVDGDLRLRYGRASCHVSRVTGSVEARSGTGDVSLGDIGGSLNIGSGSGNVDVAAVHGAVHTRAGSGTVALRAVYGDVDVVSGSGELSIGVPAGHPARLDLNTGSGRVDSQLPIIDKPTSKGSPLTIRARTGSGDISLFRAA
jgi:hypothetical protein